MKLTRIYSGIMALLMGAAMLTACSDEENYSYATTPLLTDGAVVTGTSDVTATTATLFGTVSGLDNVSPASYSTGFYYGFAQDALTETLSANSAAEFSNTLSSLATNQTIYYQAFVTLQGRLTYKGEVKSLITTDAKAITGDASDVDYAQATMAGSATQYPTDATAGIMLSASADQETVRSGLRLDAANPESFSLTKVGLLPATTYYYVAFLDLGAGVVYGDIKSFTTPANDIDVDQEFVDLGLSVKWGKRNIGAKKVSDFGGLFGFGDLTGVNPSIDPADYASADTYKSGSDLANVALGGKATLPTADLFEELFRLCTVLWTEQDGVAGYQLTGPNGNSIFLPAAGKRVGSTISDEGVRGYYLTGSVNGGNSQFAVDYEFTQATGVRATRAVYEGLSVRPVSTARNIKLDKSLLYNTWHIDLRADGTHAHFNGPCWFMGTDDSWRTITNGEPVIGNTWVWEADAADWILGGAPRDFGTMRFYQGENGVDSVSITRIDADGNATTEEGTFTLNESNKTISLSIDVLNVPAQAARGDNAKTNLNILSLTDETLQIGMMIDGGGTQLSFNYAADKVYSGIAVSLLAVGSDWGGTWGSPLAMLVPQELNGTHTVTYNGAVNGAMVTLLDFVSLKQRYPNAFVRIDDIKLDGTSIPFNANNFFYGDIEDNGNFRIEMFNIWGKGSDNGNVIASPFSNQTNVGSDAAFTFANTLEITFTIATDGVEATYTPNLITINPSWGGTWGFNEGASFDVRLNPATAKYEVSQKDFNITYTSGDHAAGSIMTFIQIDNIRNYFPTMHATLNSLKLDGNSVSFAPAGVLDSNEGAAYRLELWNMYGATSGVGCAFGTPTDGVISELGFSNTMEVNFTIQSLFAVPQF